MKVVPKSKVILPYLLLYYVFPSIVSLVYTLITQKHTIHHMYLDVQSLSGVDVCVEIPTLIAPGGTQIRNMKVNVGFGDSDVHAFTLVSHRLYEWKHLQKICIQDSMEIHHNEEFDVSSITNFVRDRERAWLMFEFDLGVHVLLGSVYFRVKFKRSVDIFGIQDTKVFDIVNGNAAEDSEAIRALVQIQPRIPVFLRFSLPALSLEALGMTGGIEAEPQRMFTISVEPLRWTEHSTTVPCTVCTNRKDIENIRNMVQSVERRSERSVMVFRSSDTSAFSVISRKYINATLKGIVIEPEESEDSETRRRLKEPLVRISINKVTLSDVKGFLCVHRALFPNSYIYELARNVRYENCHGRVDLEDMKIASGYFHNRVEHPSQYVRCDFWVEIHELALLICRVLHPEDSILSLGADRTYSMFSHFLDVWRMFVDFRNGIQVTSLGCMKPRTPASHDGQPNNIIEVRSRVIEDERALLRLSTTIQTKDYRSSPYAVLEISEDQSFVIPGSLWQTNIGIKKGEVAFNIEESIGRTVSIGRPAEIDVVFEKLGDFSSVDCSLSKVEESMYHLLVFLLCGEREKDRAILERILESYVASSCAEHAFSMRKASVMVQEILRYNRYKALFTFQGDTTEEAIVNIELWAPSVELNMFPIKDGQMSRKAHVQTEISPFTLRLQLGRHGIALQETETILPLSIFVQFSTDLMAKRFTFMYRNEESLLSCMTNFYMNFFQVSLNMLSTIKHERRGHEKIKHFSSTVPETTLDIDVNLNDEASVRTRLRVAGGGSSGAAFSIDTEKIRISAVGRMSESSNMHNNEDADEMLCIVVAPLGINLRQKNNANFYQRDIDISVWSKICISGWDWYEFTMEYGERSTCDSKEPVRKFVLAKHDVFAVFVFLREFYGELPKEKKEEESRPILEHVFSVVRSFFSRKKRDRGGTSTKSDEDVGIISFVGQGLNTDAGEDDDRMQQVVDVRCSYGILQANRIIGSIMKRINLERYPQMLSLRTNLHIIGASKEDSVICYEIVVDDFPITYQDLCLRKCEETFKVRVVYPVKNNKLMLRTSSCGGQGSFHNILSSMGLTSRVFMHDHHQNMYFSVIQTGFRANMDLCIEIYSGELLSFKMHTAACIHKDNITILPLFIVPLNFNNKKLDLLVKVYVNTSLLHSLRIKTEVKTTVWQRFPNFLLSNKLYNLEKYVFPQNNDVDIDEAEFKEKFSILKPPVT